MILKLRRRNLVMRAWFACAFVILLWIYWDYYIRYSWNIEVHHLQKQELNIPATEKIILLWTTFFYESYVEAWGILPATFDKCAYKCHFTVDKSLFQISDAVVYHGFAEGHNLIFRNQYMYPLPMPKHRRPEQAWIYYMLEPPIPQYLYEIYDSLPDHYDFNWTMSYRRDSDIFLPYGRFETLDSQRQLLPSPSDNPSSFLQEKKLLIAGMISECKRESGREGYIEELQKFIPVDIYGKCGTLSCSRKQNCYQLLGKKYKFWLSFENSLCPEYVTEKFYRPLKYGMIPVYFGHPDGLKTTQAPVGSYINTNDYDSPEALAKYLVFLDKNPEEYLKFFEWKKQLRVVLDDEEIFWPAWCQVCTKLHRQYEIPSKSYRKVADWFLRNYSDTSVCLKNTFHI